LSLALLHLFRRPLPEVFLESVLRPIGGGRDFQWEGYDDAWIEIDGQRMPSVPGGTHWGGGVKISARDQARIGQLLLDGGVHQGRELVPRRWVQRMQEPCAVAPFYGWLAWLNRDRRLFAAASCSSWFMLGAGGHMVWIEPDNEAVVVTRWLDPEHSAGFVRRVAQALSRSQRRQPRSAHSSQTAPELLYFHDPMCSWCWAFRPALTALRAQLPTELTLRRVVGGLAPDNDQPMPEEMRARLKGIWRTIQQTVPGTRFNFAFWENCTPRRSTYNACRAAIAAARLSPAHEDPMIEAIQRAYYLEARNPSDLGTLIDLAAEIGLERERFFAEISSAAVEARLREEVAFARRAPMRGFPGLALRTGSGLHPVDVDYRDAEPMRKQIEAILASTPAG